MIKELTLHLIIQNIVQRRTIKLYKAVFTFFK